MPYNNTPITPSKDITGSVSLPLARVKRIIAADDDIASCSNNAAFVITVATEMFLQHLVEQSYNIVKSERKPRRNVQYRDVANAVARVENLEFLGDVVPKTTTFKQYKARVKEGGKGNGEVEAGKGQGTLDGHVGKGGGGVEAENEDKLMEGVVSEKQAANGADADEAMDVDDDSDADEGEDETSAEVVMKEGGSEA
ncbi:hypothetical protein MBLNU230_g1666t1 [Neophaeotheca triangularis]